MVINRPVYLQQLINRMNNGMIKIITGLRRCGKSYLLFELFKDYLITSGVKPENIIGIALDMRKNEPYRNPDCLLDYLNKEISRNEPIYVLIDEVQLLEDFASVLNELLHYKHVDVYVTGSNSRFLSSDILTEFRGRGDQIRMHPLAFSEFCSVFEGTRDAAWQEYLTFGGLPVIPLLKTDEQKIAYLNDLFMTTYLKDIKDRNRIRYEAELEEILRILASATGSLTNPQKLARTFQSKRNNGFAETTITRYCNSLEDAFLIAKSCRYDIKGKRFITTPFKYYFEDVGLRNALLNFRQQEENHIMENILYNELRYRGFTVDVGVVEIRETQPDERSIRKQLEIDFVANSGSRRYYLQSAFSVDSPEKAAQEIRPFLKVNDTFKKIMVVRDDIKLRRDEFGITTIGILEFLLNPDSLNL